MAKLKAGKIEIYNHYVNNPPGEVITAKSVLEQVGKYNNPLDEKGHLYGAIIASVRDYLRARSEGKYGEYYLAFCAHYVGDLSMPLHNTLYDSFNETHHQAMDATINDEVLLHLERIEIYPIRIDSEDALAEEVARIARLSMKLGHRLEKENRLLTREEAYKQISHSASLFKAILNYVGK